MIPTKQHFLVSLIEKKRNLRKIAVYYGISYALVNQMSICWDIYPNKIKEVHNEGNKEQEEALVRVWQGFLRKNRKKYPDVNWGTDMLWELCEKGSGLDEPSPQDIPFFLKPDAYSSGNAVYLEENPTPKPESNLNPDYIIRLEKEKKDLTELIRHERESSFKELKKLEEDVAKKEELIIEQQLKLATMEIKMKDMMPIPKPKPVVTPKGKRRGGDIIIPRIYPKILALAKARMNIVMVGPTGCGKTTIAEQIAKDLKLPFGFISLSSGISEGQLGGRLFPSFKNDLVYFTSELVKFVETGGVFLFDEMDGADNNTMLWCNSLLSNNKCSVPNRVKKPYAIKHKDFIGIGAMNTFGNGADRMFVGRNQLDEATLDRFRVGLVEMDYDPDVEKEIVREDILEWGLRIRNKIREYQMRKSMSTRFLRDLTIMAEKNPEFFGRQEDWLDTFTKGWKEDEKRKII